ncbi:hypothetical protein [Parafilimonas terrae]|jgi:hypothetical protein|uniref:Tetratricopeptide repeat-containing protein n=1 Tax=Parafilimonas terrae TaxID=1465490 RepID=A0A1I5S1B1_9BACT|nr:hypothetical protein [Parafilimonas terrae]SFP64427.1 hypothetical protein SAMN05444277_101526 [Parafilimonas terrae]
MALPAENILQALFNKPAVNVTEDQLRQLTADEPYYGTAYFLLADKLYRAKQHGYEHALQKAALHFSDELLLHYNLNITEEQASKTAQPVTDEKEGLPVVKEEDLIVVQPLSAMQPEIVKEDISVTGENDAAIEEAEEFTQPPGEEDFPEDGPVSDLAEDEIINDKLSSLLQQQAAAFEKPVEEPVMEVPIETMPLHRVDYFESQGIKLDEEKPNDKLSKQLRRFTDWLKQMKSINPSPTELRSDEAGEQHVQHIAQHSNDAEEVVTETMAEVLVKQGKPQQAINIYEKLSFINPSKSAYFAAKIKELKG